MRQKVLYYLDKFFPYSIFFITLIGIILAINIGNFDYLFKGLFLAIPAILACFLVHIIKGNDININEYFFILHFNHKRMKYYFYISFFLSIVYLYINNEPFFYQFILILLYLIIFFQIISNNDFSPNILLGELLSIIFLVFFKNVLLVPLYFGTTDLLVHNNYGMLTFLSFHIFNSFNSGYNFFPIFHIFCAEGMNVLNLNKELTNIILTLPVILIMIVFSYLFFRHIIFNKQIIFFSLFTLSVIITGLDCGFLMLPRTFSLFGFILLLYLLFKIKTLPKNINKIKYEMCLLSIMVFIILVHQVSTIIIIFFFILLIICEQILIDGKKVSTIEILIFTISSIAYFILCAINFSKDLLSGRLLHALDYSDVVTPLNIEYISSNSYYINNIITIYTIFLSILSIYYIIQKKELNYYLVLSLFCLISMFLYINNPLKSLWIFSTLFLTSRFQFLLIPFMSIFIGLGIFLIYIFIFTKNENKYLNFSLFFLVILLFIAVNTNIIRDYGEYPDKTFFDSIELSGYNFVQNFIPFNKIIWTDNYTSRFFNIYYFQGIDRLKIPYYSSFMIPKISALSLNIGYIIIPMKNIEENGFRYGENDELKPGGYVEKFLSIKEFEKSFSNILQRKNYIYSNSEIEIYSN